MRLKRRSANPVLVAIVGGSGSGKTWLAKRLGRALAPDAISVCLDDFYRDRSHLSPARRARINFDTPRAIDWPLLEAALRCLLKGAAASIPLYDFKTHSRCKANRVLKPKPFIVVDGLWLLRSRVLRRLFHWRIYIDCPMRVRLARRLERDTRFRGRSEESVKRQFRQMVEPMHRRYVAPQARWADLVLTGQCRPRDLHRLISSLRRGDRPN